MEDVKWFLKKWGVFFLIVFVAVIAGSIAVGHRNGKQKDISEVIWEPTAEITGNPVMEKGLEESQTETESETELSFWYLPQAEDCLLTGAERDELKHTALAAAEQVRETYKDIEIIGETSYGSDIKAFTREQCREAVTLLGKAG